MIFLTSIFVRFVNNQTMLNDKDEVSLSDLVVLF